LDFGIAKRLVDGALHGVTNPKTSVGSPWYMPPEQMLDSTTVDQRADVWSLGVLLYELLTQEYPFNGDGVVQVCANVLTLPTPPVRALRPDVDAELDAVVQRCLEKKMERRFASVLELADALRPFGSRPVLAASALAPSEGLNLDAAPSADPPVEVEVPLESWPPEPVPNATSAHQNAPVESWAPVTVRRRQGRRRHRAGEGRRSRLFGKLAVTATLALLAGVGLSWLGFPYFHARYAASDLRGWVPARLPFEPRLNAGPAEAPLDRTLEVPAFTLLSGSEETRPASSNSGRTMEAASQAPTLSPEEAERRRERYARWLREQGLRRLDGEWTSSEGGEPKHNPEE
jgi:serine/threonine-protein kinase